jgi:CheY-like chemotaxis protein
MEAVGRLAGGVAHDFNNLLTTIGVYAELVMGGLSEESPLRHEIEQIQKANRQAASLTQQLLTLGRRSHVQVEFIDLNEVISDAGAMLRHLLSSDTKLELGLAPEPQPILGNIDQLQQILINLAINARDAITGPGLLSIETSRCTARDLVSRDVAGAPTSDEYVMLAVSDSGAGMDPETRDRAFDPFFTTKEPEQGAGLGLSIVHGIVSQADGYVRLQSAPGDGTRFELYWPLAISKSEGTSPISKVAARGRNEEILLVEDEKDLREALQKVLKNDGYSVTPAENGQEALEIAARRDPQFDLVVTDVVMPLMNGFELAERIAETHPGTRVLLVSGHLNDTALNHLPSAIPFLAKPFAARELREKVRELLDEPA